MNSLNKTKINQDILFKYLILTVLIILLFLLVYGAVFLSASLQELTTFIGIISTLIAGTIAAYIRWRVMETVLSVADTNPDIIDKDILLEVFKLIQKDIKDKKVANEF